MRLRVILLVLSLLAFCSAAAAGYLYTLSSRKEALVQADKEVSLQVESIRNRIASFIFENMKTVQALAGLEELGAVLLQRDTPALTRANRVLDHFNRSLGTDVCYLIDRHGTTIASSNRGQADSFVGENYAFRPYFQKAIHGLPSIYMALGVTSGRRGVYYSCPVYGPGADGPSGVAVIKTAIEPMEKEFLGVCEGTVLLTDPHGMVFMSNRDDLLYHLLWEVPEDKLPQIRESMQFGPGPWPWSGFVREDHAHAVDRAGNRHLMRKVGVEGYPGWEIVYLKDLDAISQGVSAPLLRSTVPIILALCLLVGVSVGYLYRKASHDIIRRKAAEDALRESEETALALLNAPTESALLLDNKGDILALNMTAAHALGRPVQDLIGKNAFDQFTPEVAETRKAYHQQVVTSGRPVRYEDVREGRWRDTHLYPVLDERKKVVRVAIFSRDVTEQKQAEEALTQAKEVLTRYSRELETQVRERTEEIASILENTPAVVFVKDAALGYRFVNSRFEELFGVRRDEIRGKRDEEIFPQETVELFRTSDLRILKERRPCQVEEKIPQKDGIGTYLTVKFPIYDEHGAVQSICGIATDITELKKAQDQLRRLSARIMTGQEKERTAIARELHDELGQMLTALRMDAVWVRNHLQEKHSPLAQRLVDMCRLIDRTIDEVQGMAIRLRPGVLDDLGLVEALEWYTTEFERRSGMACIFQRGRLPVIRGMLATASYRIAQEALTNVARHAFATHVDVSLRADNGMLILSVKDNGAGFPMHSVSESEGLGIAGMRERAGLANGFLEIVSKPGEGTRVTFRAPLQEQEREWE